MAHALSLGEPTDVALERFRARAAAPAYDTLVAAVMLQRDAGGDLAGLLRDLAASLEAASRVDAGRPRGDRPGAVHGDAHRGAAARRRRAVELAQPGSLAR